MMDDEDFLNKALEFRFITPGVAGEVRRTQGLMKDTGLEFSAPEICLKRKFMTREQVDSVLGPDNRDQNRFGEFVVLKKLGSGGMGAVYKAKRRGEDEIVALKILPKKLERDEELVERFRREAKIAAEIEHPNIVRGYEHGKTNGRYYYVMEYVEGVILADVIDQQRFVKERATIQIGLQIASALKGINKSGLVHRDIKPDNIIITDDGTAKLMDLGLMKSVFMDITTLTQTGFTLGTPQYMSYEQIMGEKNLDIRVDLYSLGATLYHMVCGEAPFDDIPVMELLQKFKDLRLVDPRVRQPELSQEFCIVLSRMLAKDRDERYGTPEAVYEDLDRIHDGKAPRTRAIAIYRPLPKQRT